MADYEFKYRLSEAPAATTDGSGMVQHQITAISRVAGSSDEWAVVPGRNKTFNVPAADLTTVMEMPDSNATQKQAKNTAYKTLLADNVNTANEPAAGWTAAQLEALMDANDLASTEAGRADDYITVTLGQSYPVDFSL